MAMTLILMCAALDACAPGCSRALDRPAFDGERAREIVVRQCSFGPRNPGSSGHAACLAYILAELKALADSVSRQDFAYTPPGGPALKLTNVRGVFDPENPQRILLGAHWDTRPWADREKKPELRSRPIPGANDGASGVAVLLELARGLRETPAVYGVDIVFFDGEDLGTEVNPGGYFRGSLEFARSLAGYKPLHALILDMVGDRDLLFRKEGYSVEAAPRTVEWIWAAGHRVAPAHFSDEVGPHVRDDHLSLIRYGIPCADLIDFDYPAWHTGDDTPDQVSAASLQVVGDTLIRLLYPD